MNTFNELLAYIATNITDAGASYRILPAMVRNSFNWFIDLVREHTEDAGIHTTQEDKDAITAHLNNNDIHLDPADKTKWDNTASNFAVHDANTQIHTSQTEKNTWNGKATIKGLESGSTESKFGFDFNNAPQNSKYLSPNNGNNLNLPSANSWCLVDTNLTVNSDTGVQVANYFVDNKIYQRLKGSNVWTPWKLIAASKMFATGYIDSVTFNGTNNVVKSVLFDDGLTRNVVFNKNFASGIVFVSSLQTSEQIISVLGTGVNNFNLGQFNLFNYNNQVSLITDSGASVFDLVITIKL